MLGHNPTVLALMAADPIDTLPEDFKNLLRKYRSVGAAIKADDDAAVRRLLDYQLETGKKDKEELGRELSLALVMAAGQVRPSMAKVLLEYGADLTIRHEGYDAPQAAAKGKNKDLLVDWIETGRISVDHSGGDGCSLVLLALLNEDYTLADELHQRGASVNTQMNMMLGGHTALHLLAANGNFQAVIWLLEKGADPTLMNADNRLASEMVPENDPASQREGWDFNVMYEALEDYRDAFQEGRGAEFEIPVAMRKQAFLESTPMSMGEAMAKQMEEAAAAEAQQEEEAVIPVKPKKIGF